MNILNCPLCGGEIETSIENKQHCVQCQVCFVTVCRETEDEVVEIWNKRVKEND